MNSYLAYYDLVPHREAIRMPSVFVCFMAALVPPVWFNLITAGTEEMGQRMGHGGRAPPCCPTEPSGRVGRLVCQVAGRRCRCWLR
ncbi:hypothetical protein ACTMU2_15835 [Cupriavidus basilensis]